VVGAVTDADIVREAFTELGAQGVPAEVMQPYFAALDALVAERDEVRNDPTFRTAARAIQEAEARAEAAEAERDEARRDAARWCDECNAAEAENARLREAADAAMHELGVPQDHLTPAPVGNAYEILRAALSPKEDE